MYFVVGLDRRIAHQVYPVWISPGAHQHAARVNNGHEYQAHGFQLLVQRGISLQTHDQASQKSDHHLCANAFEPMDTAEKADGRNVCAGVAQTNGVLRQCGTGKDWKLVPHLGVEVTTSQIHDPLQRFKLG